jgi:hypothetical protein
MNPSVMYYMHTYHKHKDKISIYTTVIHPIENGEEMTVYNTSCFRALTLL